MRSLLLCFLACCYWANVCRADYGAGSPGNPHIFSSADGEKSFKVVPIYQGADRGKAKVTLLRLERDGSEMPWREFMLDDTPEQIVVPNSYMDYFVAVNGRRNLGWKNAIVICRAGGQVVRTLELEDFLSLEERRKHVQLTVSSRQWRDGATFSFEVPFTETVEDKGDYKLLLRDNHYDRAVFSIAFPWGKKVSIELATGKVLNP